MSKLEHWFSAYTLVVKLAEGAQLASNSSVLPSIWSKDNSQSYLKDKMVIKNSWFLSSYSQREPVLDREIFHFRQNMRERTKEYRKELEEMQLRVKNRPYLFEQVTKVTGQSSRVFLGDRIHCLSFKTGIKKFSLKLFIDERVQMLV